MEAAHFRGGVETVKKASQSSASAEAETDEIIFSGGVYAGENTSRPANVGAVR